MSFCVIVEKSSKRSKGDKVAKKIYKYIENMSTNIMQCLSPYDIHITICDTKEKVGVPCLGCYSIAETNETIIVQIYINDMLKKNVEFVFAHEIGHFMDSLIGCYINKKPITKGNLDKYRTSWTQQDLQEMIRMEHDFFIQCSQNDKSIEYNDYAEIFADCFAEMMIGKKNYSMILIKGMISKYLKPYLVADEIA